MHLHAPPIQSSGDTTRTYRNITLSNGLNCVLVSDPTTDKSAAALQVGVGHMSDDTRTPGLAHFLEHMLFQGTKTYPGATSYKKYLAAHGGSSNASTGTVTTTYFFDITYQHLEPALDRFSKFFIEPLFSKDCTDRELNAVNSENAKNLLNDSRRLFQLSKHLCNSTHNYHKFGTGNRQTLETAPKELGINVRELLLHFHATYYSANIMKCCVLGRESLDDLEQLCITKFAQIPNHNVTRPCLDFHNSVHVVNNSPFRLNIERKKMWRVVPVKNLRWIRIDFVVDSQIENFNHKPASYLSHLIGHEGPGSILAELKRMNYANSLSAGLNTNLPEFAIFRISIDCTDDGIQHSTEVLQIVFQYITMLQSSAPMRWIYDEKIQLSKNSFAFKSNEKPRVYTKKIVNNMMNEQWKKENVLNGNYFCTVDPIFHPKKVIELVNQLSLDNVRIFLCHRSFDPTSESETKTETRTQNETETVKTEPWYDVKYMSVKMTDDAWSALLTPCLNGKSDVVLCLPQPNPFVPSDFHIKGSSSDVATTTTTNEDERVNNIPLPPTCHPLNTSSSCRLWHLLDDEFHKPKGMVVFYLNTPMAYRMSPRATILTELYCSMIDEALAEYTYDASCAGLSYSLRTSTVGMALTVNGYNHQMLVLLNAVLTAMVNMSSSNVVPAGDDVVNIVAADADNDDNTLCEKKNVIDEERYCAIQKQMLLRWENFDKAVPYQWASYNSTYLLQHKRWHISEKITTLRKNNSALGSTLMSSSSLVEHGRDLLASVSSMECLIMGNVDLEEGKEMMNAVCSVLNLQGTTAQGGFQPVSFRGRGVKMAAPTTAAVPSANSLNSSAITAPSVVPLSTTANILHRMVHPDQEQMNSAVEVTFQIGCSLSVLDEAVLRLLMHLIKAPCFATLRTQEQLGYTVWSGVQSAPCGVLSAWFIVQSKDFGPAHLDQRIDAFLEHFRQSLLPAYNSDSAFQVNVQSCIAQWSERDKKLSDRASRYKRALNNHYYVDNEFNNRFDRADALSTYIQTMNIDSLFDRVVQLFDRIFVQDRKKLSCQICSTSHLEKDDGLIDVTAERIGESKIAMDEWKSKQELFPSLFVRRKEEDGKEREIKTKIKSSNL